MTTKSGELVPSSNAGEFIEAAKLPDPSVQFLLLMESIGIADGPAPIYPAWVRKCAEKVNRALFPQVYSSVKSIESRRAYFLGLGMGMMIVGQKEVTAMLPEGRPAVTEAQQDAACQFILTGGRTNVAIPDGGAVALEAMLNDAEEIEADFGPADQVEFLQGKADAGRMILGENKSNESTRIYAHMLAFWRFVELQPTAQALYELLTKRLGQNVVGNDPKRVQQLCRRVGKTFGKPGRPRKTTSA